MITYERLIAAYPQALDFPHARVQGWIDSANNGLPDASFRSTPDAGRMLYVMHNLTRPRVSDVVAGGVVVSTPRTRGGATGRQIARTIHNSTDYGVKLGRIMRR